MSTYRVTLLAHGSNKIAVIRTVREITGLGIKEAKDLVDELGIIGEDLSRMAAEQIQKKLASIGAKSGIEQTSAPQPVPAEDRRGGAYRVRLTSSGSNKIAVIRTVREITGLGIKEAKDLVDELGIIAEDLSRMAAEKIGEKLASAGAKISIEVTNALQPEPAPQPVPVEERQGGAFQVKLVSVEGNRRAVIKAIQEIQAERVVDELGIVADSLTRFTADKIQEKLASAGAKSRIEQKKDAQSQPEAPVYPAQPGPVPEPVKPEPPSVSGAFVVFGHVLLSNEKPVAACTVYAFDRELRSEQLLGETRTDSMGAYRINYTKEQFKRAEKAAAILVVRAYNPIGKLLAESDIRFNASPKERIDLVVSESAPLQPSEYELLVSILTPLLEGVSLSDLTGDDVWFLANETGRSIDEIAFIADDARLSQATGMPEGVFFGLAVNQVGEHDRDQVDGSRPVPPRVDLDTMMREPMERLFDVLKGAIESRQVPSALRDRREEIRQRFMDLKSS